jgi:hypothetical protein
VLRQKSFPFGHGIQKLNAEAAETKAENAENAAIMRLMASDLSGLSVDLCELCVRPLILAAAMLFPVIYLRRSPFPGV